MASMNNGIDLNQKYRYGLTALHIASLQGQIDFTRPLLKHNIIIDWKSDSGETALSFASRLGHHQIIIVY